MVVPDRAVADPDGLDTPLDEPASSAAKPTVIEELKCADGERGDASDRGAVGRMVAELLADPALGYEAIVEAVRDKFPAANTTVRSVASTACVMRKKGAAVPVRRKTKR